MPDKPQADGKQQPLGESPFKRSHPCQDGQEGGKGGVCRHGRLPQRQHQGREEENVNGGLGVTGLPTMQHLDTRYPPTNLQTLPISTSLSTGLHSSLGAGGSVSRSAWHHTTGQGLMVRHPDYSERVPTNSDGNSHVGSAVVGRSVKCQCDNVVVGAIIWSGTTRDEWAMHLMRCLFFFVEKFNLTLWEEHLPGRCNGAADTLSQDDQVSFLSQVTSAQQEPNPILVKLAEVLVH